MFFRNGILIFVFVLFTACTSTVDDRESVSDQHSTIDHVSVHDEDRNDLPGYVVLSEHPELTFKNFKDNIDMITSDEARRVVLQTYPKINFDKSVMSGDELVGDIQVQGYMFSAIDGPDILEVIVDAYSGKVVKEVVLEGYAVISASSCTISSISSGTWYSQRDTRWSGNLLGYSSSATIGSDGCLLTSYAMVYQNVWSTPTTPANLNTSGQAAGCFEPNSAVLYHGCILNSRGGPHWYSFISMSNVASSLCAGYPVVVYVTWGSGHKMLVYRYSGGSTSSMGSYTVIDPWYGTSKSLSTYTATNWIKVY